MIVAKALDEAATTDGACHLQMSGTIFMPIAIGVSLQRQTSLSRHAGATATIH
jgi:ABC-type maltose transport system permease subunit